MMLVVKELDLEGLAGLCRLVGGDWLDDDEDDMIMWAGIETMVVAVCGLLTSLEPKHATHK